MIFFMISFSLLSIVDVIDFVNKKDKKELIWFIFFFVSVIAFAIYFYKFSGGVSLWKIIKLP